jgi:NhaP-type Na+/H+ or K+/H+ antiporter
VPDNVLVGLVTVLALGVAAQWLAWRLRAPSILFFLLFGILAGPVARLVPPDGDAGRVVHWLALNPAALPAGVLEPLVELSVAVILFEGGLSLQAPELRRVGGVVRNLLSVGLLVTWGLATAGAWLILSLPFGLAQMLGALLVVSGPTVVGPLLGQIRPKPRLARVLKWEGILIDPLGVILVALVYHAVFTAGPYGAAATMVWSLVVGGGIGGASAVLLTVLLRRFWLPDFLHPAAVLMFIFVTFAAADLSGHSGLLAVTLMAGILANQPYVEIEHIKKFLENLRVLVLGSLFVVLAAELRLDRLYAVALPSLAFLAFLIVVVRPLAVAASTLRSDLTWRERLFLALVAPRGIVAASASGYYALVLRRGAGGPAVAEDAPLLVALTFAVIIGTVLTYGLIGPPAARRLGLAQPARDGVLIAGSDLPARAFAEALQGQGVRVFLLDDQRVRVSAARLEGLPAHLGSAQSERLLDEIDEAGMGVLLALAPHEADNLLTIHRLRDSFGRGHVYRLAPDPEPGAGKRRPRDLSARPLFSPEMTYRALDGRLRGGAVLRATNLTESFTYKDYVALHGGKAVPLFVLTPGGRLEVVVAGQHVAPRPGQTVISLVEGA